MYSRDTFGSYYPVNSIIHRLNPVIKLVDFIIILVLSIICNSTTINLFIFCLVLIMCLMSYVPLKYYLKTFLTFIPLYALIYVIGLVFSLDTNLILGLCLRFNNVFMYLLLLSYTTSPSESVYGIEKFLSLFNFLFLPLSKFAIKINSLLRYYPNALNIENRVKTASSIRGVDYYESSFIGKFYTLEKVNNGKRRIRKINNKEINLSQELRLFSTKRYRTNYRTNKVSFLDIFFLLFHLVLVYAYLVEGGLL